MKEWAYTFGSVSKEQWIRQIESDLKQKTIASLQSEWWPGEPLMPLLHRDDVSEETISLPASLFTQPPLIAEMISTSGQQASAINQQILEALRQDTRSLILYSTDDSVWFDAGWFHGVFQDLITISYQIEDFKESTFRLLVESGTKDLIRIDRKASSPSLEKLVSPADQVHALINSVRFIYRIESSGIWDAKIAAVLNRMIEDLAAWTKLGITIDAFFNQCLLSLDADTSYFKHIIQTRALHLLWHNLRSIYSTTPNTGEGSYIECHIEPNDHESPDRFLIRASMSGLAASVSGSHSICIHHSALPGNPDFYQRINRNIHHLLQSGKSECIKEKTPWPERML